MRLAKRQLDWHFRTPPPQSGEPEGERPWLFPDLVAITRRSMDECVVLKDDASVGLLARQQHADEAVDKIHQAIVRT